MTETLEQADFLAPLSPEAPCGPDLDAEGDAEFMNFMAAIEGLLPTDSYFAFDRKSIDFPAARATGAKLLARSHDLRLLVLLAKLAILDRDVDGFAHWLAMAARLLAERWEDVHPRGEDGEYLARLSQLSTLGDGPVVVFPLQYAPLAETQRDGALNFRAQLVALGEARPRDGENLPNATAIDKILLNADMPALAGRLESLRRIKTSIAQIGRSVIERAGFDQALNFDALTPLVDRMTDFVQAAVARRDPSVAAPALVEKAEPSSEGGPAPALQFASLADVDAALGAALGYFEAKEPSSAAVLLIGQARQTLGKNLYDVMKLLAPAHADNARLFVGSEPVFAVPVSGIRPSEPPSEPTEGPKPDAAESRVAALGLIEAVAAHMRRVAPSSPAPYLLDRAKALASRDFLSLLKDLLSEDALAQLKIGS